MEKKCVNISFIFGIVGIFAGAFYREFTKFLGFTGVTTMSLIHTHLLTLGMIVFFIIALALHVFTVPVDKKFNLLINGYVVSVIGNVGVMFVRGLFEVMGWEITKTINASFSGVAGIAHILLTITFIWIFNIIRKSVPAKE